LVFFAEEAGLAGGADCLTGVVSITGAFSTMGLATGEARVKTSWVLRKKMVIFCSLGVV